jgi:branched-chain amino acid transport system substrate-binding protein
MFTFKKLAALLPATATLFAALALGAGAAQAQAQPLRIGFVGGITGACAQIVDGELKAMEMAVADLNAAGGLLGRKLELVKRDSKTRPDEASKVTRELVTSEKVEMLTGVCSSAAMLAMIPVAAEAKIPLLSAVGNSQKANIENFSPYFIQTQANAMQEAAAAAQFVARNPQWKKVALAGYDYEWGQTSVKVFAEELKRLRPDVQLADPVFIKLGETNMTSYITALMSREPDVVFAAVFGGGLTNLVKQGAGFGIFAKTELVTLTTYDFLMGAGDAIPLGRVHGISRAPINFLMSNPKVKSFADKYKAAHGVVPNDWALSGYDAIMFWAETVKAAGSTQGDKVIAASRTVSYDGLRAKGLKVRALDGLMNAPSYVGTVGKEAGYDFPVLTKVVVVEAETTMPSEALVTRMRAAAK